jgi:thiol-disulfide isomerase/thioredoxin
MKKSSFTIVAIIGVAVALYLANRATRQPHNGSVTRAAGSHIAMTAPEVTLMDIEGKDISLAQYKGKVVLVNFWATWCDPCRVEIPWLIEAQQKYAAKGFTILGVAMDEEGASVISPFVSKERFDVNGAQSQMNYPILVGNDATADKFGGLLGYPTSFLISREGKIVRHVTGPLSPEELSAWIKSQL